MAHIQRLLSSIAQQEQAASIGLGPHGLDQLIVDQANQPNITNSGDVILSSSSPDSALGAVVLKLVTDSCTPLGDASKRVLLMVAAGLREYVRSCLHPHTFQHDLAGQVLQCVVPSAVLHVPLPPGGPEQGDAAAEVLHALVCTHMCGHAGGPGAERHLADCLHELVVRQLRAAAAGGLTAAEALSSLRDSPPLARLPGAQPGQSRVLQGVLLHEAPLVAPGGAGGVLHSPTFLAVSCPLDGEPLTSVAADGGGGAGGMSAAMAGAAGSGSAAEAFAGAGDGGGGGGGPAVAILVASGQQRDEAEAAVVELLRQRVELLAERGVQLLLLCGRPPPVATQLCHQYGIWLVAGLDEQDVARACAAGGAAPPLTRSGLSALAAAPLGRAAAARLVALGPRRAVLMEFTEPQCQSAVQAAVTLLLCGGSEAAVRQYARAVQRCLVSLAAAVGTMARAGDPDGGGAGAGDRGECECLVFVPGGGGFEGLLELQLRELADVAKRGLTEGVAAAEATEGLDEQEEEQRSKAAAEARLASELHKSLRLLHAMAAAVPRHLTGAAGGVGPGGSAGAGASCRRAQREALAQVHSLRQLQQAALQRDEVVRCGLVVPSAAFSFHGRALRCTAGGGSGGEEAPVSHPTQRDGGAGTAVGLAGPHSRIRGADASGGGGGDRATGGGGDKQKESYGICCDKSFVRERPVVGGHSFVAVDDAVSCGVVEAAAVVTSAWSNAVDVVRQVVRIDGAPLAAVSRTRRRGGGECGPVVAAAGLAPVAVPRARRGGRSEGWGSDGGSDACSGGGDGDSSEGS